MTGTVACSVGELRELATKDGIVDLIIPRRAAFSPSTQRSFARTRPATGGMSGIVATGMDDRTLSRTVVSTLDRRNDRNYVSRRGTHDSIFGELAVMVATDTTVYTVLSPPAEDA